MRFDAGSVFDLVLSIHSNRAGCICFINRDTYRCTVPHS